MAKPTLEPGSRLGEFELVSLLHRGGMAQLWTVSHHGHAAPLLMKVPVLNEGEDPAAIVSFEMEQMIMPRLRGPHVPAFIANGDFSDQPHIVMELLTGDSLKPLIDSLPRPASEVAALGARIADALEAVHRQGIVHLDIKPSNIMARQNGDIVLIDYGLAHHHALPDLLKEEFRLPYGTAPYMAPEQVLGVRSDRRSDLFALGVLMYFFATGVRPFGDPQSFKGLKKRLWRDPVPPRALIAEIPTWLQEIILRCLEVNAARRHPTAAQLAIDLRNPDQLQLTGRATKLKHDGFFAVLRRKSEPGESHIAMPSPLDAPGSQAPIVAVALDLTDQEQILGNAIRHTVLRILERSPDARVACLNVLRLNRIAMDTSLDADGNNKHVQRLADLKDWAHGLDMNAGQVTCHVLEAVDPADAILDYSRMNNVEHIVMGARGNSPMRKLLGSVSGKVASEAPCSVTVVRCRE